MTELTRVELAWYEGEIERWIRFGRIAEERIIDRRRRIVSFAPTSIFAYVRWTSNDYGTRVSRIDILQAVASGEAISTVPFVTPGGQILLRLASWPRVERVLQAIDAVEALGIGPTEVPPDYWRHVHNRITAGQNPRPYTLPRHRAWLLRQEVEA
ncbi:MAG: DUF2840 domain-containing protein [Alphaproteobacteria bacterium]|nr:DUF2840 domain-containing protein [Alphaproteobacteria bacterium]MBV9151344.1 DUF2840 domain-containing protein [Alphaproteobacteria bacterium]